MLFETMPLFALLFSFTEFFADMNMVIKIFALLAIISFVKNHLGTSPLGIIVIVGFSYFILFDIWKLFGTIYVLYMVLMFGISGIIIDFFFVTSGGGVPSQGGEAPLSSGADLASRAHVIQRMRRPPMRPGG